MHEFTKNKSKKVLASLVMGINAVNIFAPMAQGIDTLSRFEGNVEVKKEQEIALDKTEADITAGYETLSTVAEYVDDLVFNKAHAWVSNVNGSNLEVGSMISGDVMNIINGTGVATQLYSCGTQNVFVGGTGIANTALVSGYQYINSGGIGIISSGSGGTQVVGSGGIGSAVSMSLIAQSVHSGGIGKIDYFVTGGQIVLTGGTGYVGTNISGVLDANGGTITAVVAASGLNLNRSGGQTFIGTMLGGYQWNQNQGTGVIGSFVDGDQRVSANGIGSAINMFGGKQYVYGSGTGTVSTMHNGSQMISGGAGTVSTMNSGWQYVSTGGTGTIETMNSGTQEIYLGAAGIIKTMKSGHQYINSGGTGTVESLNDGEIIVFADGTSIETVMNGGVLVYTDGTGEVKNFKMNDGRTLLNAGSDTYKFTGFTELNGGVVDMSDDYAGSEPRTYETITIENLRGVGGKFKINTDLASETNSDKILIAASDPGTVQYVQVVDESLFIGAQVMGEKAVLFATDASSNVTFQGLALDNGGLWELTPIVDSPDGSNWYLRTIEKAPNPSTEALIGNIESSYGLWRNIMTDDTLRNRLGDLRLGKDEGGVWARAKAGNVEGQGYDSKRQMFQVGIDKTIGNRTYGFAVDHSNTKGTYAEGNGKGSMTGISLYMTNYQDDGMYGDLVLRAGRLRSDMDSYGDFPDSFDFDTNGYSISYELGKTFEQVNGWFVEPQVQLAYGRLSGGDYTTERGVKVDRSAINSLLGRLGFTLGRRLNDTNDYYLKANFYREFAGKDTMDLVAANGEVMNYVRENKGNWFELGIGGNVKLAEKTYLYGDVAKTFGGDIKKKWQVNAGMRFTW